MPPIGSLLLLACAVSLDGFGVGATYGLRKIRIPLISVAIISLCSGIVILVSMQVGVWLANLFSPTLARRIGAVILLGIGCWAVYNQIVQKRARQGPEGPAVSNTGEKPIPGSDLEGTSGGGAPKGAIVLLEFKRLGLVVQILRTPAVADVDRSGIISASEAGWLGLALSLDAFGAGVGAALMGYPPTVTAAVIAASSGAFIAAGLRVGLLCADVRWVRRLSFLPGCMLVLMGLFKLM